MNEDRVQISLVCCTQTLVNEVAMKQMKQRDIASTYAMALVSESRGADRPDWETINTAILARWSMSGLERIKKRAWDILAKKVAP